MVAGIGAHTDPVFWWWEEDGRSRVVLLTDALLLLSGPLTGDTVAELESARRSGTVHEADFGADAAQAAVERIEHMRYLPDVHRLELDLAGGGSFAIQPPRSNAGVALGVFDTLAKRLAPGREPVDSRIDAAPPVEDPALTMVGAMVVLGLVCLGLAVAADQGEPTGPLAGLRSTLNDAFEQAGYLPALALFAIAAVVQIRRMRRGPVEDPAEVEVGSRVLSLDVTAEVPASEVIGDPLEGIAAPGGDAASWEPASAGDPAEAAWAPPDASSSWEQAANAWDPPQPDAADVLEADDTAAPADPEATMVPVAGDDVDEPSTDEVDVEAWSPDPVEVDVDEEAWSPEPVEDEVEASSPEVVDDEFWERDEDEAAAPWWEHDDAEEIADPEVLPPPPEAESTEVDELDEGAAPDEVEVFEAASTVSVPDPDSPFAEILDREAPMPAWASAPEPSSEVVHRSAMERSVPASLRPEPAEVD